MDDVAHNSAWVLADGGGNGVSTRWILSGEDIEDYELVCGGANLATGVLICKYIQCVVARGGQENVRDVEVVVVDNDWKHVEGGGSGVGILVARAVGCDFGSETTSGRRSRSDLRYITWRCTAGSTAGGLRRAWSGGQRAPSLLARWTP